MAAKKYTVTVTIAEKGIGKGALDPSNRNIKEDQVFHLQKKLSFSKLGAFADGALKTVATDMEATGTMFDPNKDEDPDE